MKKIIITESQFKHIINELDIGHLERTHMSNEPVTEIKITPQSIPGVNGKPRGFWYSFGQQWMIFTRDQMGDGERFHSSKYIYKVYPNLKNMMVINTEEDGYNFSKKYSSIYKPKADEQRLSRIPNEIDWQEVAKDYAGIEITNYIEIRNSGQSYPFMSWIYPLDVDGGCIWHPDGLIRLKLLGAPTSVQNLPKEKRYQINYLTPKSFRQNKQ